MFNNTIEVIETFISRHYTLEMQSVYRDTLALMIAFEYTTVYENINDVLFDPEAEDLEIASLRFHETVKASAEAVLEEHSIVLLEDVHLDKANKILSALLTVQNTEEYIPLLRMIEAEMSHDETFARIVGAVTNLDVSEVMESVDVEKSRLDRALTGIKLFLMNIEAERTAPSPDVGDINKRLEDYFKACGTDNIGFQIIESGMLLGQSAAIYYPYVDQDLITESDEQTAKNLLSFFLMSSDTYASPSESYRKYSESLISEADRITRVEEFFSKELQKLNQYQLAQRQASSIQNKTNAVGATK